MVGWLSYGNKKFEALDAQMRNLIPPLRQAMLDFIPMVDADTSAFSAFMVEYFIGYDFFLCVRENEMDMLSDMHTCEQDSSSS